jgi:aldehyde:ferredoxin oxidoreductase
MVDSHERKLGGWCGKVLHVDLSKAKIWEETLADELLDRYIGGAGLNAKLFYDLVCDDPHLDPLSPANPIIFGAGPLVGTVFPAASRYTITTKSPLTGIFGDTNAGGFFPVRMKQAGYDHIIIRGQSESPTALVIHQDKAPELVAANDMWGLDIYEADALIQERFGSSEAVRIGVAGENLVKYAAVFSGTKRVSCAGRTGTGAVMGAKRLKAIVVTGSGDTVPAANDQELKDVAKRYRELWRDGMGTSAYREYGSFMLINQLRSGAKIHNQQTPLTDEQHENFDIVDFTETYKTGKKACYRCPIACTQTWEIKEGKYAGEKGDKVEFGHYHHLGPHLGVFDFPSLLHLSDVINRLGMDSIQFGFNLSMLMECQQRGLITPEDTDGVALTWGDVDQIEAMMVKTAKREGIGDVLADGMRALISKFGPEAGEYGFHTKGMSFSYSCESAFAMSLASSVSTRGADHLKGHPFSGIIGLEEMLQKIFGKDMPEAIIEQDNPDAKGRVVWWHENYKMIMDSLGICFIPVLGTTVFGDPMILVPELGEMFQAATGRDPSDLFQSAERAYQVERCYNALLGITRDDDVRHGTRRGQKDPIHQPGMLDEYYHYRGLSNGGMPTQKRLEEVGLADVVERLKKDDKLTTSESPSIKELLPPS